MVSLKPLAQVLVPDERWQYFNRTLADHHALIASVELNTSVPDKVRQQFENARHAWLYAYYAYGLLSVAMLAVHVACESAIKARAVAEGLPRAKSKNLSSLLDEALDRAWLQDDGFAATANGEANWNEQREFLLSIGQADIGPWQEPEDTQHHTRHVLAAIRQLRNTMAHGEAILMPNLWATFRAAADFINQLFPEPADAPGNIETHQTEPRCPSKTYPRQS